MSSFESLGLSADLVEALASEGMETPTPIQSTAVPVIRRGGTVVLEAGPGAGTLVAYGVALLDRLEEPGRQSVLVLTSDDHEADALALALARLAEARGVSVSALGGLWSSPLEACVVFGAAERFADLLRLSALDLEGVEALVVDGTHRIEALGALDAVTLLAEALPGIQKVFVGLPLSDAVESLVRRTSDKPVHLPPRAVAPGSAASSSARGTLQYRLVSGSRPLQLLQLVHERLDKAKRPHVAVYFRTDDQAADLGDELALHGFTVGEFGDPDSRVWLCPPDAPRADPVLEQPLTAISYEPPVAPDGLREAHENVSDSIVLAAPRELPHLEATAREAGFEVRPLPAPESQGGSLALRRLEQRLRGRLEGEGILPFLLLAERLGETHDPLEVAAAALALAMEVQPPPATTGPDEARRVLPQAPSWVKLFFSIGSRDEIGPGDLLGAITGETGISGSMVGRIEIHESHTLVDVDAAQAERIMKAVNGTTIRGRSVRVDFHRNAKKGPRTGGRSGGGAPRPRSGGAPARGGRPTPRQGD